MNKKKLSLFCCIILFGTSFLCRRLYAEISVEVKKDMSTQGAGQHKSHTVATDRIIIKRADKNYELKYRRCMDSSHEEKGTSVGDYDTGLGFLIPSTAGWYHNNSIEIEADGKKILTSEKAAYTISELKDRAKIEFLWETQEMSVGLKFVIFEKQDGLFMEANVSPKQSISSLNLLLRCYPSAHNQPHKIASERRIITSGGKDISVKSYIESGEWKSEPGETFQLSTPEESWIFYSDRVLDPADRVCEGPCGLVFQPGKMKAAQVTVTGNPVTTQITLPENGGKFRFALFEFDRMPNIQALEIIKKGTFPFNSRPLLNGITELITAFEKKAIAEEDISVLGDYKMKLAVIEELISREAVSFDDFLEQNMRIEMLMQELSLFEEHLGIQSLLFE